MPQGAGQEFPGWGRFEAGLECFQVLSGSLPERFLELGLFLTTCKYAKTITIISI